jgi:hypothetical protein
LDRAAVVSHHRQKEILRSLKTAPLPQDDRSGAASSIPSGGSLQNLSLDTPAPRPTQCNLLIGNAGWRVGGERTALTLSSALEALKAESVVAARKDVELAGCFAADLMSDVLAFARPASILLTGLTTDQALRTAAIKHLAAVIVVEGKEIGSDMVEAAREEGIPLYRTPLSKFESCSLLSLAGLRPYRDRVPSS